MKLARVGVMAAAIVAASTVAWAQKPDFSGTWTLDSAYKLDGTESRNMMMGRDGRQADAVETTNARGTQKRIYKK